MIVKLIETISFEARAHIEQLHTWHNHKLQLTSNCLTLLIDELKKVAFQMNAAN